MSGMIAEIVERSGPHCHSIASDDSECCDKCCLRETQGLAALRSPSGLRLGEALKRLRSGQARTVGSE
jgi:hypothetical protein